MGLSRNLSASSKVKSLHADCTRTAEQHFQEKQTLFTDLTPMVRGGDALTMTDKASESAKSSIKAYK